ncbi:unnamed protein product [Blepharisma stoltei]|uniref:Uncharacterized protein n=1 Tax=Blepharisma stoltei TaxID=1481888 RepID=A0AAU9IPC9_9CILI|nr:unnamed protein product [Blepharisma stoltei]
MSFDGRLSFLKKQIDDLKNEIRKDSVKELALSQRNEVATQKIKEISKKSVHGNCIKDMNFKGKKRLGGFSCQLCQSLLSAGHSTGSCKHHQKQVR